MKTNRQKPVRPPQWAEYLMELFIPLHRLEVLQGDLYELFYKRVEQEGLGRARLLFIRDVVQLLRPQLWQEEHSSEPRASSFSLFSHYLLVAFRNLKRSRFYTGLNVSGLAIGIATCYLSDNYHLRARRAELRPLQPEGRPHLPHCSQGPHGGYAPAFPGNGTLSSPRPAE